MLKNIRRKSNSKKNKTKHTQVKQQFDSNARKIRQTKEKIAEEGQVLHLAAALYIYNDHEVYYLSSGSNPKYNAYMGAYRLQWDMIQFAKNIISIDIISTVLPETLVKMPKMLAFKNLKKDLTLKFMNILVILLNQLNHCFIKLNKS